MVFEPLITRVKLAHRKWLTEIATQVAPKPEQSVLEVGIGGDKEQPSDNYKWFKTNHYTTLDIDEQYKPSIVADITKWEPLREYDYVIMTQTLEHIFDYKAALATCRRACTKGGYFILTMPFIYPYHYSARNTSEEDYWRFTAPALERILYNQGWHNTQLDMPDEVLTVALCQK